MINLLLVLQYWRLLCRPVNPQEVLGRRRRRRRVWVLIVVAMITGIFVIYGGDPIELVLLSIVGVVSVAAVVARYLQGGRVPTAGV